MFNDNHFEKTGDQLFIENEILKLTPYEQDLFKERVNRTMVANNWDYDTALKTTYEGFRELREYLLRMQQSNWEVFKEAYNGNLPFSNMTYGWLENMLEPWMLTVISEEEKERQKRENHFKL